MHYFQEIHNIFKAEVSNLKNGLCNYMTYFIEVNGFKETSATSLYFCRWTFLKSSMFQHQSVFSSFLGIQEKIEKILKQS